MLCAVDCYSHSIRYTGRYQRSPNSLCTAADYSNRGMVDVRRRNVNNGGEILMIILSRRDTEYHIQDVMITLDDGATIDQAAEALRCFLLACGYHHDLVYGILPDE